eukprot:1161770-Pelagomonas_calceolata.AAC.1
MQVQKASDGPRTMSSLSFRTKKEERKQNSLSHRTGTLTINALQNFHWPIYRYMTSPLWAATVSVTLFRAFPPWTKAAQFILLYRTCRSLNIRQT